MIQDLDIRLLEMFMVQNNHSLSQLFTCDTNSHRLPCLSPCLTGRFLRGIKLPSLGGLGIWALIDLIMIATGDLKPRNGEYSDTFND